MKHNNSVEECLEWWTRAFGKSTFARIKERLFGEENYEKYIGRVQKLETSLPDI
jgi:hypothetical protein